jgi:hypothetical protein
VPRNYLVRLAVACALASIASIAIAEAQRGDSGLVAIDPDDIGGVVRGPQGPEAGVWVVAETTELPTKYRKIVVTDDQGRYLLPDLPRATYRIWVRGYGLVDSAPISRAPGQQLNLVVQVAPSPRAAAEIYPANYWYSLIEVPAKTEFPGTGPEGNGIARTMRTQADWISQMKNNCVLCHLVGNKATRELSKALGSFNSSREAWSHRVQVGQDGGPMSSMFRAFGPRGLEMFADWTDRIAAGAVPPAPPRPQGIERNLVLTMWDWGGPTSFVHDEIATDKRNPTVNAGGPLYGVDIGTDKLLVVDPASNKAWDVKIPLRDPAAPSVKPQRMLAPSPYWGDEIYWNDPVAPHSAEVDQKGRVWMTSQIERPGQNLPAFCKDPSNPFVKVFSPAGSSSETGASLRGGSVVPVYDPVTKQVTLIDTCFATHHLQFAEDKDNTVYFSGDSNVIGWINTRTWDQTADAAKSQGWCPVITDHNGDGVIGKYTEPTEPLDPRLDRRISGMPYGIIVNPVDKSVWYATPSVPGRIVRLEIGANPPATCRAEVYEPPFNSPGMTTRSGYTPKGVDADRNGIIWTAMGGSGHLASFDRRKCKVKNGATATGQHCVEGWTLYPSPGPKFKGVTDEANADHHYYNWVDQFDTLGLGKNIPLANGTNSDSLLALLPNRQWVTMRVPYPLGFYTRSMDGRIDDPNGGWKGRGMYADYGVNNLWHTEGGKGTRSAMVKFQIRPTPLAK